MKIPDHVPEEGFYYHYKHDPSGTINNYAYELVGVGCHTEEDENMVIYRPLYPTSISAAGKLYFLRPLEMWIETVEVKGKTMQRFQKIADDETRAQLEIIKKEMYPKG
jgi:hypothetical protein